MGKKPNEEIAAGRVQKNRTKKNKVAEGKGGGGETLCVGELTVSLTVQPKVGGRKKVNAPKWEKNGGGLPFAGWDKGKGGEEWWTKGAGKREFLARKGYRQMKQSITSSLGAKKRTAGGQHTHPKTNLKRKQREGATERNHLPG